jgi:hypothetical protein
MWTMSKNHTKLVPGGLLIRDKHSRRTQPIEGKRKTQNAGIDAVPLRSVMPEMLPAERSMIQSRG